MGHDEDALGSVEAEPLSDQSGPRRSSFTPAPAEAYKQYFGLGTEATETVASSSTALERVRINPLLLSAPPPSAATVVVPPPGSALPTPPRRTSLPDDELVTTLDTAAFGAGGALQAIERFELQLLLREQEAREFRSWESSMLAIGTPEALDVVEETRTAFTEVIQVIPAVLVASSAPPFTPPPAVAAPGVAESTEDVADLLATTETAPVAQPASVPEPVPAPESASETAAAPRTNFAPESNCLEPTPPLARLGGAARLFWLWFAANSSVISIVFGGMLLSLGMSLRQAIVATLAGVAVSFLPLGLGTLASKWNGQPTLVVSRATFGLAGNVVPTVLSLITRLFWGAVLLWFLAMATARILTGAGLGGTLTELQLSIIAAVVTFLIALVIAFFGFTVVSRVQLVLSILSGVLIVVLIVVTWPLVDFTEALTVSDGPWVLVLTGGILVFSLVGLLWSTSSGDVARYQRPSGSGALAMIMAPLGSAVPAFVLIGYGALIAASNPRLAFGFVADPIDTLASIVPAWFIVPLLGAIGIGMLSGVILSVYSGGFALLAIGARLRREYAILLVGLALGGVAIAMTLLSVDLNLVFRDFATTLAVPTAAWVGLFSSEMMIRNRRFDAASLLHRGGVYPAVNWVNLGMFALASLIGYGLITATAGWLRWQGFLFEAVGIPVGSDLARADIGVLVALVIALATPIVAGIPAIRRQEQRGT